MKDIQQTLLLQRSTEQILAEEVKIKQKLEEIYAQEEILWRQKSQIQWLKEGERNSNFFHHYMI
jgi:hypothetical protein